MRHPCSVPWIADTPAADGRPPEPPDLPAPHPPYRRGRSAAAIRVVFATLGVISLVIGIVGLVIPLVPTTVFLLVAAACFARSSERLHRWLLGQPMFGPIIATWQRSRAFPPGIKRRALVAVAIAFAISIALVDSWVLRAGLLGLGLAVSILIARIPTVDPGAATPTGPTPVPKTEPSVPPR
jgi:uncharacterized membrane protein YbaN (DUF454 family)